MSGAKHIVPRGWCPGVRRPMETGDGLLVRLHPFGGALDAAQARLVAGAAHDHGNGLLDITARGNLQIRGVRDETYPGLLALLEREGLAEPEGDGPNRLTTLSPLAGLDPDERCDARALAQDIERRTGVADLPPKVFVTVDGGGAMPLDALGADLHLQATESDTIAFAVPSPDGLVWTGATPLAHAPDAAHAMLSGFAQMRRAGRTEARRLRDLHPDHVRELAASAALGPVKAPTRRQAAPRAGILPAVNGCAILLALPFGRCSAAQLAQAAEWSERFGNGEIRLSFTRGALLPGVAETDAPSLLSEAERAGFITAADDPRLSLLACPGKPDCASAKTQAPADALRIAEACPGLLAQGVSLHVSGCPKGCAHPGKADLTLVGRTEGGYDVVPNGCARDAATLHLSVEDIMTRLLPLQTVDALRRAFPEPTR
ncbi:precorrin-3B synthase [Microvirga flocculans]|uniref:Precorrin-3B synthase n=1 Tax=Microvirga flocculans TaxID=217168 RepID=A0A7W6IDN2_9HYPH|nr:precorrin-3B synthase [Microvirga flocculans]MBB4039563.1 precorrin-3B synthase [Microvirga flocculans]